MLRTLLITTALLAGVAGCGAKPDDGQSQPEAAAPAAPADAGSSTFSVDPASIADCAQRVEATLKWDARVAHPGVANVQIFAGTDASSTLFAEGGSHGDAKTGPWTGAGSLFSLRDKADGKELARVKVAGPACP